MRAGDKPISGAVTHNVTHPSRQLPIATIATLVIVALVTGLQFVYPVVLETLRRNPVAFASGQWWRLLSPLLVHADGPAAWIGNSIGIAFVGPSVERVFGKWRWLLLLIVGGLAGNISGYAWEPYGAGTSVGMFGLIGGLFVWLIVCDEQVWPVALAYTTYIIITLIGLSVSKSGATGVISLVSAVVVGAGLSLSGWQKVARRIVAVAGLLGAIALTALSNNHGPPIIVGACVAGLLLWRDSRKKT